MKVLVVADPLEALQDETDTTLYWSKICLEAGAEIWWAEAQDLSWFGDHLRIQASSCELDEKGRLKAGEIESFSILKTRFDWIWLRKEPPYDFSYLKMCWRLSHLTGGGARFLNSPESLLLFPEKEIPLYLVSRAILQPDNILMTCISDLAEEQIRFVQEQSSDFFICKPWDSFAGKGVRRLTREELLQEIESRRIDSGSILQVYNPSVESRGDRRVLILDGRILGSFVRVPQKGGFLANLVHGASLEFSEMSEREEAIANKLAAWTQVAGLHFIGADLIGERLNEVNTTCPTGLLALEKLSGRSQKQLWRDFFFNKKNGARL
ncbi:MAG: hypothetical protein EA369_03090 [Bradymonadales bacterium]|nr:MAG: hypothetical protein EA369_03090 [Bradymonadales bacterium]